MGQGSASALLQGLRAVFDGGSAAGLADGPLLERFAPRGEDGAAESAFAALVERHGPMVWRVCRATLRDEHEAEDAFQAVFLVLARKARSLWVRDSIGPWLHQVALRTAAYARSELKRRRDLERRRVESTVALIKESPSDDPSPVIHEELGRLPDRYRAAVVLCDLEGLSHEEAARQLGWPIGTVKSRQSRGRARLRDRLIRRGLGPSAVMLSPIPPMPTALIPNTVAAALGLARNGAPAASLALMKGVLTAMAIKRFQAVAALALLFGSAASVAALAASRGGTPDDPPAKPAAIFAKKPAARPIRDVLRDAARAAAPDGDVNAAANILLQIARAQARAGDREGALETARRVSEAAEGLGPGAARTLIALAYVRDAAGDRPGGLKELDRADRLPDEQTGAIETPAGPNSKDWFPARRLIAEARFDLGDVEAAKATVQILAIGIDSLRKDTNRIMAAAELAIAQVKIGDIDGAFRTYDQAANPGDDVTNSNKRFILRAIIKAGSSAERWAFQSRKVLSPEEREARRPILKRIEEVAEGSEFDEDKCHVELAIAWAELGDFDSALRVAHRIGKGPMRFPGHTDPSDLVYALGVIGGKQGQEGRKAEAAATLREALDLVEHHPELASRRSQIAGCQLMAGDSAGAFKTMESASAEERALWLMGVARHQSGAGDQTAARATLLRALNEAERLLEAPAPPPTRFEEEQKRMDPTSAPADRELAHKDQIRGEIAEIHAGLGHIEAATTFLRKITPGALQGRFCAQSIARARAEDGDVEGALNWAMTLDPPLRAEALRGLAEGVADR